MRVVLRGRLLWLTCRQRWMEQLLIFSQADWSDPASRAAFEKHTAVTKRKIEVKNRLKRG